MCKPNFQYVKNKRQRDASMSSEENGGEDKRSKDEQSLDEEVELVMNVLSEKGDVSEAFKTLVHDKTKIKSEGKVLYQLLIEIMLTKFGTNQMEHVQRGVDKVKSAIVPIFADNSEA